MRTENTLFKLEDDRLSPHDWFCYTYSIDILEERLDVTEHSGHMGINFIDKCMEYYKTGELL